MSGGKKNLCHLLKPARELTSPSPFLPLYGIGLSQDGQVSTIKTHDLVVNQSLNTRLTNQTKIRMIRI